MNINFGHQKWSTFGISLIHLIDHPFIFLFSSNFWTASNRIPSLLESHRSDGVTVMFIPVKFIWKKYSAKHIITVKLMWISMLFGQSTLPLCVNIYAEFYWSKHCSHFVIVSASFAFLVSSLMTGLHITAFSDTFLYIRPNIQLLLSRM